MKVDRENQFWYKNARLLSVSVDSAIDRIGSREESPPLKKTGERVRGGGFYNSSQVAFTAHGIFDSVLSLMN